MANEKRLIDVNQLNWGRCPANSWQAKAWLDEAPTVDAVEVVRCKDCKHCKKHPTSDRVKMCTNEQQWVTECYPLVHDDDFCSYGERRSDG